MSPDTVPGAIAMETFRTDMLFHVEQFMPIEEKSTVPLVLCSKCGAPTRRGFHFRLKIKTEPPGVAEIASFVLCDLCMNPVFGSLDLVAAFLRDTCEYHGGL